MSRATNTALAFGALLAAMGAPQGSWANGQPVISLPMIQMGPPSGAFLYSDRAQPLITLPVRRVVTNGENTDVEYDTTAAPQIVTSCPNPRSVQSGDGTSVECDEASAAAASHAMPNVGGGHNSALWNLRNLPPSIR